jgi:hypothetical protein
MRVDPEAGVVSCVDHRPKLLRIVLGAEWIGVRGEFAASGEHLDEVSATVPAPPGQ